MAFRTVPRSSGPAFRWDPESADETGRRARRWGRLGVSSVQAGIAGGGSAAIEGARHCVGR
eukprot:5810527-Alexandrium_andersonii.AAC.1